jgi:hypothetical protein
MREGPHETLSDLRSHRAVHRRLPVLFTTAYQSGYWTQTNLGEVGKLFVIFVKTLQYSYLFGIIPVVAIAAIDDILAHVRRIGWVARVSSSARCRLLPPNCSTARVVRTPAGAIHALLASSASCRAFCRRGWRTNMPKSPRRWRRRSGGFLHIVVPAKAGTHTPRR